MSNSIQYRLLSVNGGDVIVLREIEPCLLSSTIMMSTAAIESTATNVDQVIEELKTCMVSERGATRLDDRISDAGMEDRKIKGYF